MNSFGRHLVEQKLISKEKLLDCLVEYARGTPSVAEFVYKNKLLDVEKQIEVLDFQSNSRLSYWDACVKAGVDTNQIKAQIQKSEISTAKNFINVLIEKGGVEVEQLTVALDEYVVNFESGDLERLAENDAAPLAQEVGLEESVETPADGEVATEAQQIDSNDTRGDYNFKFSKIDTAMVQEYDQILSADRQSGLNSVIDSLFHFPELLTDSVASILRDMHTIRAGAKFINAEAALHLLSEFHKKFGGEATVGAENVVKFQEVTRSVASMVWELNSYLQKAASEAEFFADVERVARYGAVLGLINEFDADVKAA